MPAGIIGGGLSGLPRIIVWQRGENPLAGELVLSERSESKGAPSSPPDIFRGRSYYCLGPPPVLCSSSALWFFAEYVTV